MKLEEGDLVSEVRGSVGKDEKVLIIRRIDVTYRLRVPDESREVAERVLGFHAGFCPVARSIEGSIEIGTALEFV